MALFVAPRAAAQSTAADVVSRSIAGVVQVIGDFGHGSGFIWVSRDGLVLTNAHVTAGQPRVHVKLSPTYKVAADVVLEDRARDIAVVRVHPDAVRGRPEVGLESEALAMARVGDPVVVLGFPGSLGAVATTGILAQKSTEVLLTDAGVAPGNSGGPVFALDGGLLGMTTFGTVPFAGNALGGAMTVNAIGEATQTLRISGSPGQSADSLPVLPTDRYPIEALEAAVSTEDWPDDLYDLSDVGIGGGSFSLEIATPPLFARHSLRMSDLTIWQQQLSGFPPIVVFRITPNVGQSALSILANIILVGGGIVSSPFDVIWDMEARGQIASFELQGLGGPVQPIGTRWSRAIREGEEITVLHLVLSPDVFLPDDSGVLPQLTLTVTDPERGTRFWSIPQETIEQVISDFRPYFGNR